MQIFVPVGQVPPQLTPSHVAAPPVGTGQGLQLCAQCATSVFETHWPPQRCAPATHPPASTPAAPPEPTAPPEPVAPPAPGFPSGLPAPTSMAPEPVSTPPEPASGTPPSGMGSVGRGGRQAISSAGASQINELARSDPPGLVIVLSMSCGTISCVKAAPRKSNAW
jgi:hypothetical protein